MFPETDGISKLISDTMKVVFQRRLVDPVTAITARWPAKFATSPAKLGCRLLGLS